jgi:transposase
MKKVITIGLDLAKRVFQVHGVDAAGAVVVRRSLRRSQVVSYFSRLSPCVIGMEACATSHYWGRVLSELGHTVRLIAPAYAKAYVRRNKNDPADAAAICEAVSRPSMRFVPLKTAAEQAAAGLHRVREQLMKQRTMLINGLRGLMAEFGIVVAEGPQHVGELVAVLADGSDRRVAAPLHAGLVTMASALADLERHLEAIDRQILAWGRRNQTYGHLITIPGFGPILSSAMAAMVVKPAIFASGRDFAASLGLAPRQESTGGKTRLGPISKRGNGYLRRLLVNGAMSVLSSKRAKRDPWLIRLLETKHRMVAAVALANKMARIAWAVMVLSPSVGGGLSGRRGRFSGLARVHLRDGIVGQSTDRGQPFPGHEAMRPRGLDQASIHQTHQGLRPSRRAKQAGHMTASVSDRAIASIGHPPARRNRGFTRHWEIYRDE